MRFIPAVSAVRIRAPPPYRGVEQLVARRAHNPKVGGSSPPPATKYADVAQSAERILGKDKVTSSILVISSILKLDFLCIRGVFFVYIDTFRNDFLFSIRRQFFNLCGVIFRSIIWI